MGSVGIWRHRLHATVIPFVSISVLNCGLSNCLLSLLLFSYFCTYN